MIRYKEWSQTLSCVLLLERVKAGLRNTKAKGTQLGHPSAIKIDARFAARVKKLYAEVLSYRKVAQKVGVSYQTVATICRQS